MRKLRKRVYRCIDKLWHFIGFTDLCISICSPTNNLGYFYHLCSLTYFKLRKISLIELACFLIIYQVSKCEPNFSTHKKRYPKNKQYIIVLALNYTFSVFLLSYSISKAMPFLGFYLTRGKISFPAVITPTSFFYPA